MEVDNPSSEPSLLLPVASFSSAPPITPRHRPHPRPISGTRSCQMLGLLLKTRPLIIFSPDSWRPLLSLPLHLQFILHLLLRLGLLLIPCEKKIADNFRGRRCRNTFRGKKEFIRRQLRRRMRKLGRSESVESSLLPKPQLCPWSQGTSCF
jgi:hypothetical protein